MAYAEQLISTESGNSYRVLVNEDRIESKNQIVLMANKQNVNYCNAVYELAAYYTEAGYDVSVFHCTELMMLSKVHAGKFDIFLMSEEI